MNLSNYVRLQLQLSASEGERCTYYRLNDLQEHTHNKNKEQQQFRCAMCLILIIYCNSPSSINKFKLLSSGTVFRHKDTKFQTFGFQQVKKIPTTTATIQIANTWLNQDESQLALGASSATDNIDNKATSNEPLSFNDLTASSQMLPPSVIESLQTGGTQMLPPSVTQSLQTGGTQMLPQQETQFEPFHDSVSLPNEADPPATSNAGWHSTEQELHDPSQRPSSCVLDQPLQGSSNSTPHNVTQISQDCEGDSDYGAPTMINLETSGLRRSSKIRKQSGVSNDPSLHGPTIVAYTKQNFTFNQMLKENDYANFFQAMLDKISVHFRKHFKYKIITYSRGSCTWIFQETNHFRTSIFPNQCLIMRECENTRYTSIANKMPMYRMITALF